MTESDQSATQIEHATGAVRELREYARGVLDVDHHDVHPSTGLIRDSEIREVLNFMAEVWNPTKEDIANGAPRDFWQTQLAQRAIRKNASDVATQAIREGNVTQTAYLTGLPSYDPDVSGMHAIMQLAEWLIDSEACKVIYLAALMGRGKTDLSLTFLEVIEDHYRRIERAVGDEIDVERPEFAANFNVETPVEDSDVLLIDNYRDLVDWMERGDSSMNRWFVFDEASSELTAQSGKNAQKVVEKMGGLIKKMRKMGVNLIVIGHDKGDVHVAIRSLADFVDKTGLKTASFYAGIKKREPTGHLFDLSGIPPTSWTFNTDDTADWDWCDEEGQEEIEGYSEAELREYRDQRIANLYETTEIAQTALATAFDVSPATVSRAVRAHESANTSA